MDRMPAPSTPVPETAAQQLADATAPHPRIYEVPPEQGRDILLDLQRGDGVAKPDIDEEWVTVDGGPTGSVAARIVRPRGSTGTLPVILYIHGAGWVFGDEKTHDRLVRELAVGSDAAVVFPLYDRSPEAKYPTAVEQNYAVGRWITEHGQQHRLDSSTMAVCGDSVGGNMATVYAMMTMERGDPVPCLQVLLYPVTNADFDTTSYQELGEGYYLTRDGMMWFWDQYTMDPRQRDEPHACPLRASVDELRGMPPTLIITDEADVLRDEGEMYAAKLREAGVDVTAVRVLGMVHDFLMLDSLRDCNGTKVARLLTTQMLRTALHGG